jgi:hypothetical protein
MRYLRHIREVWSRLVGGDEDAMGKIDTATVKALGLRARRASTKDAEILRAQPRDGTAFGAFNASERNEILHRLQTVDGLIPSLFTFFRDIQYPELYSNSVKRLTALSRKVEVFDSIQDKFIGVNQVEGRVKVQVAEHAWVYGPGTVAAQKDLGYRQIYAYAMREYPYMPREASEGNSVKKPTTKADGVVLGRFANLAYQLGFHSHEITALRSYHASEAVLEDRLRSRPPPIRAGSDLPKAERCGIPRSSAYEEVRDSLFINHLHDERQGEGVTVFFVRQSVYFAFFGRPAKEPASEGGGREQLGFPSYDFRRPTQGPSPTQAPSLGELHSPSRASTNTIHGMARHVENMGLFIPYSGELDH